MFDESRFLELLGAYFDQSLTPEGRVELEQTLLGSDRARRAFWEHARLHAVAREWGLAQTADAVVTAAAMKPEVAIGWTWWKPALALAASVALAWAGWWFHGHSPQASKPVLEAAVSVPEPVAVLVEVSGVEWAAAFPPTPGSALPPGRLRLKSGVARIDFFSGASALLAGPAELQIFSEMRVRLHSGRIHVRAPAAAHGFTVQTGDYSVVDHGTEFGVGAEAGQPVEVHVFSGRVELDNPKNALPSRTLLGGNAVRRDGGAWQSVAANRAAYPDREQFTRAVQGEQLARQKAWSEAARQFSASPGVLLHYLFDASADGQMVNAAPAASPDSNATVIGCERVDGRWLGKPALAFMRVSDRVRFALSGSEYDALTFMAWVRVDALPNDFNNLFRPDDQPHIGYPYWLLDGSGRLRLGYLPDETTALTAGGREVKPWVRAESPPLLATRMGRWTHLATVVNMPGRLVTHYVDGQPVSRHELERPMPLRIGSAELGSSRTTQASADGRLKVKNFVGCMDEFALLSRALGADEIRQHYESGRP
ncbi:MAG: FecR domain-containing protein [Verrucomicrobia bacterium]|nr:FecR domain-containing protein [Verrucomicrobiota bacterium]